MSLNSKQRRYLRSLAHGLHTVIAVGHQGITAGVTAELNTVLNDHELVKMKLPDCERERRQEILEKLCAESNAEMVQTIGRIAVLYRAGDKNKIVLPR